MLRVPPKVRATVRDSHSRNNPNKHTAKQTAARRIRHYMTVLEGRYSILQSSDHFGKCQCQICLDSLGAGEPQIFGMPDPL